jgi:hypothetical protein
MQRRDQYIEWMEDTEVKLSNLTYDTAVVELLHTARYWEIRRIVPSDARPIPLIEGEFRSQRELLHDVRVDLEPRLQCAKGDAHITVLDTQTLLHYEPPQSIRWTDVVRHPKVRLVIPLRVIEEVDARKYSRDQRLRDRARGTAPPARSCRPVG